MSAAAADPSAPTATGLVEAGAEDLTQGWRRTSPLGIIARGVRSIGQAVLPAVAVMFGSGGLDRGVLVGVLVGLAVILLGFVAGAVGWWRTQYRIGVSDVRLQRGLVSRQARSVPFERIQDVSLEQGLVPRLLGLVEVRFETGAGGKDEIRLAFVAEAEGEALRETVRARLDLERDPFARTSPAPRDAVEAAPLFAMDTRRLLLFGTFEFSLVAFAVLAGAAQQFEFLLPFDLWDLEAWQGRLAGAGGWLGAWLAGLGLAGRVLGALAALGVLGAVGLATGIARTFARDYRFRLERTAKGFRRRRGLFTRTDVVMPVHRVQALSLTTGVLRRQWGWHGLAFVSLAQDAGSANHTVAPFAQIDELAPIAQAAGFALPGEGTRWQRPSPLFHLDRALIGAALPLAAMAVALSLGKPGIALGAAALAAVLLARRYFLWRRERHALDDAHLYARSGWLSPRLVIADRAKLHSVELIQGPLARRRGYADLRFGLAGGKLSLAGLPLAEARGMAAAVLASIAAVDFSRLPR